MRQVTIDPEALIELEEAVDYLEDQEEGLGTALRSQFEEAVERLSAAPDLCPPLAGSRFRKCFVKRFNYVVFFLASPEHIWIAAFAHGSRRPGYWRKRRP